MASDVITHVREAGLGEATQVVGLKGHLRLESGAVVVPSLVLTEHTALLVGFSDSGEGLALDLARRDVEWGSRLGRDSLKVGEHSFDLPVGGASRARDLIRLGRVRGRGPVLSSPPDRHRYVTEAPEVYEVWLTRAIEGDEPVLAWLGTASEHTVHGQPAGDVRFVLTPRRALWVAIDPLGAVWTGLIPPDSFTVKAARGRDPITAGGYTFLSQLNNESCFAELAPVLARDPAGRLGAVARLLWLKEPQVPGCQARLLADRWVAAEGGPAASLTLAYVDWHLGGQRVDLAEALAGDSAAAELCARQDGSDALLALAEGWQLDVDCRVALVRWALSVDEAAGRAPRVALPLHEATHELLLAAQKDPVAQALADIALAEHSMVAGQRGRAQALLEQRLGKLPDETLADLLPPEQADLTEGSGGQSLRVRLLELLVQARGEPQVPDVEATAELARLQPLVPRRLEALVAVAPGSLGKRARTVLKLLKGEGLGASPVPATAPLPVVALEGSSGAGEPGRADIALRPLPVALLEEGVQHPAARSSGALGTLQRWLGKERVPDQGALRAYSERLSATAWPEAAAAIADAILVLGLPADVGAFVSRGEMSVGVRAYAGRPPFLLVGVDHLTEGSDYALSPLELRFAVGAELAHLRFNHTRLTASEVWDGVLHSGSSVVDAAVALVGPLGLVGKTLTGLSGVGRLHEAGRFLQKQLAVVQVGAEGAASVVGASHELRRWVGGRKAPAPPQAEPEEELLAFCRSLQLTADRAGLVLCGDLVAASRGVLKTHRGYLPVLEMARRHGLSTAVGRRGAGGEILEQSLAVRLAALYAFYLSDDYVTLRAAALRAS